MPSLNFCPLYKLNSNFFCVDLEEIRLKDNSFIERHSRSLGLFDFYKYNILQKKVTLRTNNLSQEKEKK